MAGSAVVLVLGIDPGFRRYPAIPPPKLDLESAASLGILLGGLFAAGVLIFAFFVLLYLSGDAQTTFMALQEALWPALIKFSIAVTTAFVLASLGVLIFLPLYLLKMAREGGE